MKSKLIALVLAAWIALEILAFALIVHAVGIFAAIALDLAASLFGLAEARGLLPYLRGRLTRPKTERQSGETFDGALQALGSLLLILPGLASDFVGLALKSPSIRQGLIERLRARGASDPRLIDLDPREWRHIPPPGARRRARSPRGAAK
ncbi:FxsA family protein [Methylocystis sp. 9N]|uniref:FxsA family protein n=1 Tax=Methylocystis borbori TaxID=3118750 RepID=A0ABU7XIW3_9HYPH